MAASWSPYVVGTGIGVLIWVIFLLSDRPLGCSTAYAKTAGMIESAISSQNAEKMAYYGKFSPTIDWQWMLVVGTIIGAALSAYLSGGLKISVVPPFFKEVFGSALAGKLDCGDMLFCRRDHSSRDHLWVFVALRGDKHGLQEDQIKRQGPDLSRADIRPCIWISAPERWPGRI
ncbi:MAG: YeeE/YedE family protein [Methanothrix sp.]|nr:YeeE/YedE family protein [Methanothrix sp.]